MKKWFNVKPKVNDFSEDEIDTESEDGDGSDLERDLVGTMKRNQAVPRNRESGPPSRNHLWRLRRRKSETLRVEYISSKEIRVAIGTWNVAGRLPHDSLDIDCWLGIEEPADMYVIGFQEVVALNAGNVLGAEDSSPIPKWEAIIRKRLNQTQQEQTKCKSYSAPPSPVLSASSTADVLDDGGTLDVDCASSKCDVHSIDPFGLQNVGDLRNMAKFQLRGAYGPDGDNKFCWPERPLDAAVQGPSTRKLRRVLSSTGRLGSHKVERQLDLPSRGSEYHGKLKRVFHSSGNLGLIWPVEDENSVAPASNLSKVSSDILTDSDDDTDHSNLEENPSSVTTEQVCRKSRARYVRIVSKQMVGIYISIWVRRRLRRHINNLKVSPVGVGLMGYMGNKGSISVSLSLYHSRLCFVCSHLTSGQKDGDEERRNSDVHEILRRTRFSCAIDDNQPQTIPSHDQIFWFGDLNYRLNMDDMEVRSLVAKGRWDELIDRDQLCREFRKGRVFGGWKEGTIDFAPTYKYEFNSDRYAGETAREGEKRRSPAWCDRILFFGKGIKQLSYSRAELRLSDHRPVSSTFLVEVEVFNRRRLERVLSVTNAGVYTEDGFAEDIDNDRYPVSLVQGSSLSKMHNGVS
ncbi:type I inositol polyphosphate 5-phosphatase 2 isoform X2 [Nymphaea colorata]|nr:type I inositol polyphosphate 5-phosphatase 2 isoform X2 [Nymphaea colorata]